jgi:hypothetical protein
MFRTKFIVKKKPKGNNSKIRKARICTALLFNEIYRPTKFHVDISYTFRVYNVPEKKSKCKNEEKALTPKLRKAQLRFFCTALLSNELYLAPGLLFKQTLETPIRCCMLNILALPL